MNDVKKYIKELEQKLEQCEQECYRLRRLLYSTHKTTQKQSEAA